MYEEIAIGYVIFALAWFMLCFGIMIAIIKTVLKPSHYRYRKYLTNLFIAGKVRQIADKHKVNLSKEEEGYLSYKNKLQMEDKNYDLDDRIEHEIQEEVAKI